MEEEEGNPFTMGNDADSTNYAGSNAHIAVGNEESFRSS